MLIFELDPRNHLSEQHLMELAAILGVVWTLSVLTFLYSQHMDIPAYINPLALVVMMAVFMLNPTRTFRHEARFWMLRVLFRIVCAPFFYVGFADFWVADQLNSLAVALTDLHYLVCFYLGKAVTSTSTDWGGALVEDDGGTCGAGSNWVRAVVMALPAWFRFAQCCRRYRDTREAFPHLVNAGEPRQHDCAKFRHYLNMFHPGKYSTTFFVVLFATLRSWEESGFEDDSYSAFFYPWVLAACVSTLYAYAWDIFMDWGLFDSNAGENRSVCAGCQEFQDYCSTYVYL